MERILLTAFQAGAHMEGLEEESYVKKAHKDVALILLQILDEDSQDVKLISRLASFCFSSLTY